MKSSPSPPIGRNGDSPTTRTYYAASTRTYPEPWISAVDEPLYDEAVAFVLDSGRASISAVQRKLRIGYNRAARLIEQMEEAGLISPMNSNGGREILVSATTIE